MSASGESPGKLELEIQKLTGNSNRRAEPAQLEIRERPAESPLLKVARADCIREFVESIASTNKLEPDDQDALAKSVKVLSSQVEDIRRHTIVVYADDKQSSGPWTLNLLLDAPL